MRYWPILAGLIFTTPALAAEPRLDFVGAAECPADRVFDQSTLDKFKEKGHPLVEATGGLKIKLTNAYNRTDPPSNLRPEHIYYVEVGKVQGDTVYAIILVDHGCIVGSAAFRGEFSTLK